MTLDEWLIQNEISEAKFASRIGRTQATVNRVRRGLKECSAETARAIHRETSGQVTFKDLYDRVARGPAAEAAA